MLCAVNRAVFFKIFKGVKIRDVDSEYLKTDSPLEWRLLGRDTLELLAKNPDYDISDEFLAVRWKKGMSATVFSMARHWPATVGTPTSRPRPPMA